MRNLAKIIMMALVLVFVASSCQKEGIYNPKKKIERITREYIYTDENSSTSEKYVSQIWKWDGNLLNSITFYAADGDVNGTETYNYDGKRLASIDCGYDEKYVFNYDGNKISRIDYFDNNTLESQYVFIHDGSKISQIDVTFYDNDAKKAVLPTALLNFVMPGNAEVAREMTAKINQKIDVKADSYSYSWKIEWNGNNISKMTIDYGVARYVNEFSYDSKKNPYFGLFDFEVVGPYEFASQNNVITYTETEDDDITVTNFYYTYDGSYPTCQAYDRVYTESSCTIKYHYEYK